MLYTVTMHHSINISLSMPAELSYKIQVNVSRETGSKKR